MMTPQEVSGATFEKAMRGYNMAAVDEFLDKLTEDYSHLYKENGTLKSKMKVLVEKLEEYRQTEDSLRGTLLAAQKLADQMVREAEEKRDNILAESEQMKQTLTAEAEKSILARVAELQQEVARQEKLQQETIAKTDQLIVAEKERLNQAKAATADFLSASRAICQSHLALLDHLPDLAPEEICPVVQLPAEEEVPAPLTVEPEPAIEEPTDESEAADSDPADDVLAAIAALTTEESFRTPEEPSEEEAPMTLWDDAEVDLNETRVIQLDQLQFGRNYSGDN